VLPRALRLAAAATGAAVLATAPIFASSCSGLAAYNCNIPSLTETGADGGLDPCHCDPPASLNILGCGCLNGPQEMTDAYHACMALYRAEMDASAD
jgi:hypothetical protein